MYLWGFFFLQLLSKSLFVHLIPWTEEVSTEKGRGEERGRGKFDVIECP